MIDKLINDEVILFASGSNSHGQLGIVVENQEDLDQFTQSHRWQADASQDNERDICRSKDENKPLAPEISCSFGGRHSLFLMNHRNLEQRSFCSSIYSCGDSSQGQSATQLPNSQNMHSKYDCRHAIQKIDYKHLVSKVSNIDQDLKTLVLQSYQPVQVAACWETSFVVLSHRSNIEPSNQDTDAVGNLEGVEQLGSHDDYVLAFGSDDFDLRGSNDPLEDLTSPNFVDLPRSLGNTGRKITLYSGCKHIVALVRYPSPREHQPGVKLIGWGAARHGQLGPIGSHPKPPRSIKPTLLSISIPTTLDYSSIKIALGNQHTVVACPTRIWCWGTNRNGQIPVGLRNLRPEEILELQASWNATFVLSSTDHPGYKKLTGYGNNAFGQLGAEDRSVSYFERLVESSYARLCAGSEHFLITKGDHQLWGWGWNEHGNLGKEDGRELQQTRPFGLIHQTVPDQCITQIGAGCATSFVFCQTVKPSL